MKKVIATSFADPADVRRFKRCKSEGKSDLECFRVGDNGIGCWGDDTTAPLPMVALPPEEMREKFGQVAIARGARVTVWLVSNPSRIVVAEVRDRMPEVRHRKNGAGLDMNPELCDRLGVRIPARVSVEWEWA